MVLACIAQFRSSGSCQVPAIRYRHIEGATAGLWLAGGHEWHTKVPNSSRRSFHRSFALRTYLVSVARLEYGWLRITLGGELFTSGRERVTSKRDLITLWWDLYTLWGDLFTSWKELITFLGNNTAYFNGRSYYSPWSFLITVLITSRGDLISPWGNVITP